MLHRIAFHRGVHGVRFALVTALLGCAACAIAQKSVPSPPPVSRGTAAAGSGSVSGGGSSSSPYLRTGINNPYSLYPEVESDQRLEDSRVRAREADRQKRMVEDTNRLVALAARYRASVSEHGSPSAEDNRLLADMEKLARSVKDRMRGM